MMKLHTTRLTFPLALLISLLRLCGFIKKGGRATGAVLCASLLLTLFCWTGWQLVTADSGISNVPAGAPPFSFMATITVRSSADAGGACPGATCTLRQAIATAAPGDTIDFDLTTVTSPITLASELAINKNLTIQGPGASLLTISGNNSVRVFNIGGVTPAINVTLNGLTIANGKHRGSDGNPGGNGFGGGILNDSTGTLSINNAAITGNSAVGGDGSGNDAVGGLGLGGGIYNRGTGTLNITNSTISGNSAKGGTFTGNNSFGGGGAGGGGIYNINGTVNLTNSTLSDNSTTRGDNSFGVLGSITQLFTGTDGGGIINSGAGTVNVTNSTVSGNSANGGTIRVAVGQAAIVSGSFGGGIYNGDPTGTVKVANSTFFGNSVRGATILVSGGGFVIGLTSNGGGIFNAGQLTIANSTFSGNLAVGVMGLNGGASGTGDGGGIDNGFLPGSTVTAKNTIIAGNTADIGPDFKGPLVSLGYNLIGNNKDATITPAPGTADQIGTPAMPINPLLAPLASNGGPTQTMALLTGSPAIDKGAAATNPITGLPITTDQRGFLRPVDDPAIANATGGNGSDIGAFEVQGPAPTVTKAFSPATIATGGTSLLTITLGNANANGLTVASVTDTLPAGLTTVGGTAATTCGVAASQTAGSVSLSGGTIPAGGSCTLSVQVTSATGGVYTNTIAAGALTTNGGANTTSASATLTVVAAPTLAKSFNPTTINPGASSQLTLTFTNPAGNVALTNLAVTDNLPAGLSVAATPGLNNTCGGTVTGATAGSSSFSLSGGALAAGASSCVVQVNVTSTTLGSAANTTGNVTATGNGVNVAGATASATLAVTAVIMTPPVVTIVDPFGCTGPGDALNVTLRITNSAAVTQSVSATATLLPGLFALPGASASNVGTINTSVVTPQTVTAAGTLLAGQTVTITYQAQVGDVPAGTVLTINTTALIGGVTATVAATATVNCPPVGPGALYPSTSQVSDQKAGSVLIYPVYTSDAANGAAQNARLSFTNTNPTRAAYLHLFFVDGTSCSVADSYLCLTPNQTAAILASDVDPGTTGYVVAVATDLNGCPINFNHLIGDEYAKFSSGHQANLAAESIAAVAGGLTACNLNSDTAQLNFNGTSYNALPRVLAASNLPSRADGNDTLLIVNRIGGHLGTGAATLGTLFGLLYDDAEKTYSFSLPASTCQSRGSLTNDRPRVVPRYDQVIGAGRTGWLKIQGGTDIGILGAQINRNANAASNAGAFNQGHNLHKLTLTTTASVTIPVFPPTC